MGKVYFDMGFLATAEVVEGSATDLVGQYVGQTGPKAQKLLEKALGKVLFIDEAYRLAEGAFAKEAMDEIVDCITKPKFAQKLIIILAGYDADINRLMSMNPGLTSRFPESVQFRGLNPLECMDLLTKLFEGHKRKLLQRRNDLDITVLHSPSIEFSEKLQNRFEALSTLPNWASARDVQTISKNTFGKLIASANGSPNVLHLEEATILAQLESMIAERAKRGGHASLDPTAPPASGSKALPRQSARPPAPFNTRTTSTMIYQKPAEPEPSSDETNATNAPSNDESRDVGVSQEVWDRLQQDKLAAEAREREYERLTKEEDALANKIAESKANAAAALEQRQHVSATQNEQDLEAKRRHEEARLKHELDRRAHEEQLDILRQKKAAEEARRKKEREAQTKLREMGVCCAGFRWIKGAGGYRCAGGSHYVADAQLGMFVGSYEQSRRM